MKTGFIQPFKFFADIFILFDQKQDESLYFYIYYQDLNNPTIKNYYFLPLINTAFDKLG